MRISNLPSSLTDWSTIVPTEHLGQSGKALMRSRQFGEIQIRMVDYSAGYVGDHWCGKGHLVFVVSGAVAIEHEDGTRLNLSAGMSWHVADDEGSPHKAVSAVGATVFVVD